LVDKIFVDEAHHIRKPEIYKDEDEIENDCHVFSSIVKQQIEMRVLMFKQNLKNYIKMYLSSSDINLKKYIITGIHKMAGSLFINYSTGAVLCDILFTDQIIEESEIKKYSKLIRPFISNGISEEKFLNQMLVMFDKYHHLIEPELVKSVFYNLLEYKYINTDSLVIWYDNMYENNLADELKIKYSTIDAVHNFLEDIIQK
jgi:hypothetical protein